jgi:hypothetical protein
LDRNKIIVEYGEFIEHHTVNTRIEEVSVFPYPKETILSALLLEIACGNVLQLEALRICARFLTQFQLGVGPDGHTKTASELSRKAVILIEPKNLTGKIVCIPKTEAI